MVTRDEITLIRNFCFKTHSEMISNSNKSDKK